MIQQNTYIMALMDVFTHFSIIRRERRGIRPEEIKAALKSFELKVKLQVFIQDECTD